jgi:hypothetical protein
LNGLLSWRTIEYWCVIVYGRRLVNNPVRCYEILKFLIFIYVNLHVDYNQVKDNQI